MADVWVDKKCLACRADLTEPMCQGPDTWVCVDCNEYGICPDCHEHGSEMGRMLANGVYRCGACGIRKRKHTAKTLEVQLREQVFGDPKALATIAAGFPWYQKSTSANRVDVKIAHDFLTHPPTNRELDLADKDCDQTIRMAKLRQTNAQMQGTEFDEVFFKEAHHKIKARRRERTKWSDMLGWSSAQVLTHLRNMSRKFEALMLEDKQAADIWELARALCEEREFMLMQLLESEKVYQTTKVKVNEEKNPNVRPLARTDTETVTLFVTWARSRAREIKSPKNSSVENLKAIIYKDSILHAKLLNIANDIESIKERLDLPMYKANKGGASQENAVKSHAKQQATTLLDFWKAGSITGKTVVNRAKTAGPKVVQQVSDQLNEACACRNCLHGSRSWDIAKTHKVRECHTLGYDCALTCTKCNSPTPHWEWECPAAAEDPPAPTKKKKTRPAAKTRPVRPTREKSRERKRSKGRPTSRARRSRTPKRKQNDRGGRDRTRRG